MVSVTHCDFFSQAYDDSLLQASIKYGPLSIEVETKLHALDEHVERLLNQLKTTTMDTMVGYIFYHFSVIYIP